MMAALASRMAPLALDPIERWSAARNFKSFHWGTLSQPVVWVPLLVVAAMVVAAVVIHRRRRCRRDLMVAFGQSASEADLTGAERTLLVRLAEAADPRPLTGGYTLSSAFETGARRLLAGRAAANLSPADRGRIHEVVRSLWTKLGLVPAAPGQTSGAGLARDDAVTLSHPGAARAQPRSAGATPGAAPETEGTVTAVAGRDVTVRLQAPLALRTGGAAVLRHVRESIQWEYKVTVISQRDPHGRAEDHEATVRLIGTPRQTNLRRFARVPISRPAHVARYGFVQEGADGAVPEFVEARLHEIAGPGLRLETKMAIEDGQRILVVLDLGQEGSLRAVGVVRRRVADQDGGRSEVAVELTPVSEEEVARLVKETNAAARRATAGDAHAAAGASNRTTP